MEEQPIFVHDTVFPTHSRKHSYRSSWCDPYKTFLQMYTADPLNGFGADNRDRAIGGEAAMWGETVCKLFVFQYWVSCMCEIHF